MKKYIFWLRNEKNTFSVTTFSNDIRSAIKEVLEVENLPLKAVFRITSQVL